MLDSSPIALPVSPRRPLKRSASVASLPTPPRTRHKRKRGGSKHSDDSEEEEPESSDVEIDEAAAVKEAEDEEAFWLSANKVTRKTATTPSTTKRVSAPLLYRKLQQSQPRTRAQQQTQSSQGLVSPPPSHRKPVAKAAVAAVSAPQSGCSSATSPPKTPPSKPAAGCSRPSRDSPENPFLASPLGPDDEVFVNGPDSILAPQDEKATMAFVFRGVRKEFPNPHLKAAAEGPNPNSMLPPEHPDFEPDERGVRKLLFGVRRKAGASSPPKDKGRRSSSTARGRQSRRVASSSTSEKRTSAIPTIEEDPFL